jgi:hypothetical protein
MTWSLLLEKENKMQESSMVSIFHIMLTDSLEEYYVKVLDKINSKFNGKLDEINSKFNKKMNLCYINNMRDSLEIV